MSGTPASEYEAFLSRHRISLHPSPSPVFGLLNRLRELDRREARTEAAIPHAATDRDRERGEARLEHIERERMRIHEQLDEFPAEHVQAITGQYEHANAINSLGGN